VQTFRCCAMKKCTTENKPPPKHLYFYIEITKRKPKSHRCCNNLTVFLMTCAYSVFKSVNINKTYP
jgi:hypothetical protein